MTLAGAAAASDLGGFGLLDSLRLSTTASALTGADRGLLVTVFDGGFGLELVPVPRAWVSPVSGCGLCVWLSLTSCHDRTYFASALLL